MESCNWLPAQLHFNPRSPHGERPVVLTDGNRGNPFQSTLPARGATIGNWEYNYIIWHFNPRSPHGERPIFVCSMADLFGISIHAPRTGSDDKVQSVDVITFDFNPRSPHGERQRWIWRKWKKL